MLKRRFLGAILLLTVLGVPADTGAGSVDWFEAGRAAVEAAARLRPDRGEAKNVILFLGDGMSLATVAAARILAGQRRGEPGEENLLSFENLPYTALVKTYNTDLQVGDSAGTMTAIVTGEKTRVGMLSVSQEVLPGDISTLPARNLKSILEIAEENGLSTGVVTTTRLTHATPAACYAHSPDRNWESDANLPIEIHAAGFPDIARQLIEFPFGDGLEVAMGGGRYHFLPDTVADPEEPDRTGGRADGRDLTEEWLRSTGSAYIWNQAGFDAVDPAATRHLLGLFEIAEMEYEHDRRHDRSGEPSLSQMTAKAIDILARNRKGFFLMVEGGRIDHAHHASNAYRALTETIEFAKAVQVAIDRVDRKKTLILVTADHSMAFSMSGYPARGNPILGKVRSIDPAGNPMVGFSLDLRGLPYTTLNYTNGPGYSGKDQEGSKGRRDLTGVDTTAPDFLQAAAFPLIAVAHSGEDVPVYAAGPQAYLVHGVQEQNYLFHVMVSALGFGGTGSRGHTTGP
ncbi:MAG: alkaline phosphatase [Acidobacteria bacterium]|nr:alkaline phosphatase [Acidobacteriota bacterium]